MLLRGLLDEGEVDWGAAPGAGLERLARLGRARDWLCSLPACPLRWDEGAGQVVVGGKEPQQQDKASVMKHMAELWLRQEVEQLECEADDREGGGIFVLDGSVLLSHLGLVRRTVAARHWRLVVPAVAVRQLDQWKKGERGAREAIRWLERELGRGNRWLRAQKEEERLEVSVQVEGPGRDRGDWEHVELLECLAWLAARPGPRPTLLTADPALLASPPVLDRVQVEGVEKWAERLAGRPGRRHRSDPDCG